METGITDCPGMDYLVCIEGFLVPLAQIKAIGWIEKTYSDPDAPYEPEQYYFRVYLSQPEGDRGDGVPRDLAAFFDSETEATQERMALAKKVNAYYQNMFGVIFPTCVH